MLTALSTVGRSDYVVQLEAADSVLDHSFDGTRDGPLLLFLLLLLFLQYRDYPWYQSCPVR